MRGFLLTLVVLFATATARDHHGHRRTQWGKNGEAIDAELLLQANEASTLGLAGSRPTPIYPAATLPPLLPPPPLGVVSVKNVTLAMPIGGNSWIVGVIMVTISCIISSAGGCGRGMRTLSQRDRA